MASLHAYAGIQTIKCTGRMAQWQDFHGLFMLSARDHKIQQRSVSESTATSDESLLQDPAPGEKVMKRWFASSRGSAIRETQWANTCASTEVDARVSKIRLILNASVEAFQRLN
jgi:hypothetical protein